MVDISKKLGKRLQEIRKMRSLTQSQLAELIGVETMTISRIENGTQFPKPNNLNKLAKALNVEVKELFSFGHYETKNSLVNELCGILKQSSIKDLQLYKKIICSHIEYTKH